MRVSKIDRLQVAFQLYICSFVQVPGTTSWSPVSSILIINMYVRRHVQYSDPIAFLVSCEEDHHN